MKNKKPKKEKSNEDKKEDTLTKILILIIFIIIVFYAPDLWKMFDIPTAVRKMLWESKANDNIEAYLSALEGEEYLFVDGFLRSKCTRIDEVNHCPYKLVEANPVAYFDQDKFFYDFGVPMRLKAINGTLQEETLEPREIHFVSFVKKGRNKIIFILQDYLLNLYPCNKKKLYVNGTICPLTWKKGFGEWNVMTNKRDDISIEISPTEINRENKSLTVVLRGRVRGKLENPVLEIRVYGYGGGYPQNLISHQNISLKPKDDYYSFNATIILQIPRLSIGYFGLDEEEEIINEMKKEYVSNLLLLLFRDNTYFYAKEIIIQDKEVKETVYE